MIAAAILALAGTIAAQAEIKHAFIVVDNGTKQLVYVDQFEPSKSWKTTVPAGSRDIDILDDNRVLMSNGSGAAIYSLKDGKEIWKITGFKGVQTASLMQDGNYLIGASDKLVVVDPEGETVKTIISGKMGHLRLARQLNNGNVLYASGRDLYEVDMDGKKIWTHTSQNKTYLALEERDGSFLLTAGDGVKVLSVTREGKVSLVCGGKADHPNVGLAWFSGFDVLGNGNIVVANWCGHGFKGEKRHLIEFDRNNKIVWQWSDADVKSATTVQILK
jgi:outer membrane protein assembly factor BamB